MESNKTYPLPPDQNDQPSTPSTPPISSTNNTPLTPPSTYNSSQNTAAPQSKSVPWYLRPLTKTTQSPLTSTQTRPFVPREPLPPSQQNQQPSPPPVQPPKPEQPIAPQPTASAPNEEPISPFRSQPLPPLRSPYASPSQQQPAQQQSTYQQPGTTIGVGAPRPFSQFDTTAASRPSYGVPDTKPKKIQRIIGIILVTLLVTGIGIGAYSLWQRTGFDIAPLGTPDITANTAEDRLHQTIDKHLQTKYVRQVYEQVTEGAEGDVIRLDTTSDFSDPANPKSLIRYDLQTGSGENAVEGAGEIIVVDKNEYFSKLTKPVLLYEGEEASKPKENQWYQISSTDDIGEMLMDPISTRASLNSPIGEVPVGNFNNTVRQDLMQFVTGRNVYKIKNSNEISEDNKRLTHYNIEFNAELVNELNKKIASTIGIQDNAAIASFTENDVKDMEIWVSNETERITKIKFGREYSAGEENGSSTKEIITVSLSYPNDGSAIKKPEGAVAGPWTVRQ